MRDGESHFIPWHNELQDHVGDLIRIVGACWIRVGIVGYREEWIDTVVHLVSVCFASKASPLLRQNGIDITTAVDSSDMNTLRDVTDEIMRKIQSMSGQEYVDIYATKRKTEISEEE